MHVDQEGQEFHAGHDGFLDLPYSMRIYSSISCTLLPFKQDVLSWLDRQRTST
jgi:hypothetical protein